MEWLGIIFGLFEDFICVWVLFMVSILNFLWCIENI